MRSKVFGLVLLCSGCGLAYESPRVESSLQDGTQVNVVALTAASIQSANASTYEPRTLPAAFFSNASVTGGQLRGAGALPNSIPEPQSPTEVFATRFPPEPPSEPYMIGVGDVLIIAATGSGTTVEELSGLLAAANRRQGYTVQDDGAIAVPDIGRINVDGLTVEEAEDAVFQRLVENQLDPSFSIEIAEFKSQRVSVGGAVKEPGIAPITLTPLFLDEAINEAGGLLDAEDRYVVISLYRDGSLYQIPATKVFSDPDADRIRLIDGDRVFVDSTFSLDRARLYFEQQIRLTETRLSARRNALAALDTEIELKRGELEETRSNFERREELGENDRDYVYVAGEVRTQRSVPLPYGRRAMLADALFAEGGIPTQTGNPGQIYVLRANEALTELTAYQLDGSNAANMILATRMELRPNDIIFVSEQLVTKWNRVVSQILPSLTAADAVSD